jgi:hypothetical protein
MDAFDANHSGAISLLEFLDHFQPSAAGPGPSATLLVQEVAQAIYNRREALATLFHRIDRNGDGMLSFEEFRDALSTLVLVDRNLTSDQIAMLVQHLDRDADGRISWEEFLHAFGRPPSPTAAAARQHSPLSPVVSPRVSPPPWPTSLSTGSSTPSPDRPAIVQRTDRSWSPASLKSSKDGILWFMIAGTQSSKGVTAVARDLYLLEGGEVQAQWAPGQWVPAIARRIAADGTVDVDYRGQTRRFALSQVPSQVIPGPAPPSNLSPRLPVSPSSPPPTRSPTHAPGHPAFTPRTSSAQF